MTIWDIIHFGTWSLADFGSFPLSIHSNFSLLLPPLVLGISTKAQRLTNLKDQLELVFTEVWDTTSVLWLTVLSFLPLPFLRMIFEYVASSAEKAGDKGKKAAACVSCCLDCFNRLIKFLNEQAYVRIALTGENFCPACKSAFFVGATNPARYLLVNLLGGAFVNLGVACIAMSSTYAGYLYIMN